MRNSALLIGTFALAACSLDRVMVAELDEPNSAGSAGSDAAGSGADAGAGGVSSAGVATSGGGSGRTSITIGGSAGTDTVLLSGGDGGDTSEVVCSCLGQRAQFCGSDGLTYPDSCDDAGMCLPPAIACFHACPCLEAEPDSMTTTSWFALDCVSTTPCTDGVVCMKFSNVMQDTVMSCSTMGN